MLQNLSSAAVMIGALRVNYQNVKYLEMDNLFFYQMKMKQTMKMKVQKKKKKMKNQTRKMTTDRKYPWRQMAAMTLR